jgi:hypothetical protein
MSNTAMQASGLRFTAIALGALLAMNAAHALVYAPDVTPENDIYDGATRLEWIKTPDLQTGQSLGYRLATAAEAQGLLQNTRLNHWTSSPYQSEPNFGEPRSIFFSMGTNFEHDQPLGWNGVEAVSLGYVDGGTGAAPTLAGMVSTYWVNGSQRYGIDSGRIGGYLVGTQADFEADKFTAGLGEPFSYYGAWTKVIQPGWYKDGKLDVGYFMVKSNLNLSPIPEAGTSALMALGLAGLVGVGARRRSQR